MRKSEFKAVAASYRYGIAKVVTIRTKVCIVGVTAPGSVGGLAAYQRWLSAGLETKGCEVSSLSLLPRHRVGPFKQGMPDSNIVTGLRMLDPIPQRLFRSLASRPSLHFLAELFACSISKDLLRQIDRLQPSLIHFLGTGWLTAGFALRRIANLRCSKFSVLPAIHSKSWGDDQIDLRLYQGADVVICLSNNEALHLRSLGHSKNNLVICGLPSLCRPDGNAGRIRAKLGLGDEPIVFFLGRRDEGKGYFALLDAWQQVIRTIPNAQLLVAGPGAATPKMSNVHDLGCIDELTKADAYSACNVFCLPSAHESFGIVFIEAWSYAKPVICGEAPACRELISDQWNGLYGSHDVTELANVIKRLLVSTGFQAQLGANGKLTEQRNFCPAVLLDKHLAAWGLKTLSTT